MTRSSAGWRTPGPWTIEEYGDDDAPSLVIHKDSQTRICFMATPGSHGDPAKIEANARLIAEAGTVAHETGLTPRQLAEQRAELLAVLKAAVEAEERATEELAHDGIASGTLIWMAQARTAIARATDTQEDAK